MATIKDVALRAGVSVATVSNYLNQTKPVSKAASLRIKQAIAELHYTQNLSAKSLKMNAYSDVGVVLPNFNDPYYVQMFQGIESVFQNSGYYLNLAFSYDIPELEQNVLHNMLRKQVCGLILITCRPDDWKFYYENFTKRNRPLVLIDRAVKSLDASFVSFDNRAAMLRMTRLLLQQGCESIYLMAGPGQYTCEADCIAGFLDAHREAGRQTRADALVQTDLNKEDAFRKTTALLRESVPDAILATSELTATGVIEGLRVLGYPPSKVPVFTLGEEHWNRYTHSFAAFSTARPAIKLGERSASLLIEKLQSPQIQESERIVLHESARDAAALQGSGDPAYTPQRLEAVRRTLRILMLDTPPVHSFCRLLKNFENRTGIRCDVTLRPHHNLYETIVQSSRDHVEPAYDVYMYDIPWLPLLASQKVLGDISEPLQRLRSDAFLPGCLRYFSEFQGSYYGVPFMYAPQILYYRKDLFNDLGLRAAFEKQYGAALRPPLTFREFNVVAEFFTHRTDAIPYGISIPAAYDECLAPELYMRLRAYGSQVVDANGGVVFDNPQTLKAYINFVRAIKVAKPDYLAATDVSIVEDFLRGETAMLISYPPFLTNVSDLRKSSMIGSIGYSHIPGRCPLLGGWSLGIDGGSAQRDAAFSFLEWTCSEQMANYFALLGGQSAIASTYTNDELVKLYPWLPLYESAYQYTQPMLPPVIRNGRVISPNTIDQIVCKWAYRLIGGGCGVEEILAGTQEELETAVLAP